MTILSEDDKGLRRLAESKTIHPGRDAQEEVRHVTELTDG